MPVMSAAEALFCRSAPWRWVARRLILPWALQGTTPEGHVLEIGSGSGTMAAGTMQSFPDCRLTVTDLDLEMLAVAQRQLTPYARVAVLAADATRLPLADGCVDTVVSHLMLHHVIDWERAVAEAGRVLRPGGSFVGYDLVESVVTRWLHWADRSPHRLIRRGQLESALNAAGLVHASTRYEFRNHVVRFIAHKSR